MHEHRRGIERVDHRRDRDGQVLCHRVNLGLEVGFPLFQKGSGCRERERFFQPFTHHPHKRRVSRHRLQTTAVPTAAADAGRICGDVADLAGHAAVARKNHAAHDDAQPQPLRHVEHREVVEAAGAAIHPLGQAERLQFVHEKALDPEPLFQISGRIPVIEQMQIWAENDLIQPLADEAGNAHTHAVGRRGGAGEDHPAPHLHLVEQFLVGVGCRETECLLLGDPAVEAGFGHAAANGINDDAEHGGGRGRHRDQFVGPPERWPGLVKLLDKPPSQKGIDDFRDRGRRESRQPGEGCP